MTEEQLTNKYPLLKISYIECDSGWLNLIDKLCSEIIKIDKNNDIQVQQIKEKYGTLRFYISYVDGMDEKIFDKICKIILKFENKSAKICEVCGYKGNLKIKNTNYKTLCNKHAKENGYIDLK